MESKLELELETKLKEFNKFNYIGSKYKLINNIIDTIEQKTRFKSISGVKIGDLFSGTSIVGHAFRLKGANVISNDYEYYGYVIARAFVCSVYTENVEKRIEELNNLKILVEDGLVYTNYAPTNGNRMYFTDDNAKRIDTMRTKIESWKLDETIDEDEYYYLVCCLMLSSDKVANIASVYGAFLKKFKNSALKMIEIKPIHRERSKKTVEKNKVYNEDINDMVTKEKFEIVYLDPPYNERQYSKNYHILNYIALYSKNVEIKLDTVTGLLKESNISLYCKKKEIEKQFEELLTKITSKYVFMSYNSESLMLKDVVINIMEKFGKVEIVEIEHKRFKSNSNCEQRKNTTEYIFCLSI